MSTSSTVGSGLITQVPIGCARYRRHACDREVDRVGCAELAFRDAVSGMRSAQTARPAEASSLVLLAAGTMQGLTGTGLSRSYMREQAVGKPYGAVHRALSID